LNTKYYQFILGGENGATTPVDIVNEVQSNAVAFLKSCSYLKVPLSNSQLTTLTLMATEINGFSGTCSTMANTLMVLVTVWGSCSTQTLSWPTQLTMTCLMVQAVSLEMPSAVHNAHIRTRMIQWFLMQTMGLCGGQITGPSLTSLLALVTSMTMGTAP